MYKIIATDLDESLLQTDKNVSSEDIQSIQNLKDCKLVVNTGRGYTNMQYVLKQIGTFDKENEYTISFNGGVITENKNNRILYKNGLSFIQIKKIFDIGLKIGAPMEVFTSECFYLYLPFENELNVIKGLNYHLLEEPNIDFLMEADLIKIMLINEDLEMLAKWRKEIGLEDEYEISTSSNRYLEFNAKGVSKGNGLLKLCELLNIDIQNTISLGDNNNDLSMIKMAGLGVAVSNASEEIKKECDVILDVDNNHNPMTELINRFVK